MIIKSSPPVGTPIRTKLTDGFEVNNIFNCVNFALVQSGTAALAMTLQVCRMAKPTDNPEVIIPAYSCPDLVAASVFAGVKPVIVDVQSTPYGYSKADLLNNINARTVAVVCPTLFGIRMNLSDVRNSVGNDVYLIEDNAQWFPEAVQDPIVPKAPNSTLEKPIFDHTFKDTDFSVLSFGKGKPVNMLGGGAVFLHTNTLVSEFTDICIKNNVDRELFLDQTRRLSLDFILKAYAFNLICKPIIYGLVSRILGSSIGATVYKSLYGIENIGQNAKTLLSDAIFNYRTLPRRIEKLYRESIVLNSFADQTSNRLLRYPIIFRDSNVRNEVLRKLIAHGIGASPFYNATLNDIPIARDKIITKELPIAARQLADNLLTLPTHVNTSFNQANTAVSLISEYQDYLC